MHNTLINLITYHVHYIIFSTYNTIISIQSNYAWHWSLSSWQMSIAGGFWILVLDLSVCFHLRLFFLLNAAKNWGMWQTVVNLLNKSYSGPSLQWDLLRVDWDCRIVEEVKIYSFVRNLLWKNESSYTIYCSDNWLVHYGDSTFLILLPLVFWRFYSH